MAIWSSKGTEIEEFNLFYSGNRLTVKKQFGQCLWGQEKENQRPRLYPTFSKKLGNNSHIGGFYIHESCLESPQPCNMKEFMARFFSAALVYKYQSL